MSYVHDKIGVPFMEGVQPLCDQCFGSYVVNHTKVESGNARRSVTLLPSDSQQSHLPARNRHYFEDFALVLDVALLLDHIAKTKNRVDLQLRRGLRPLSGVLALGCMLAQHLRPGKPLPFTAPWQKNEYKTLEGMAREHWVQLSTGHSIQRRWPQMRKFYRSTLPTHRARARRFFRDIHDGLRLLTGGHEAWQERSEPTIKFRGSSGCFVSREQLRLSSPRPFVAIFRAFLKSAFFVLTMPTSAGHHSHGEQNGPCWLHS